ncbi:uncharacterized protein LOC118184818 isoform X2 [Stegodyphus dumicola]|nr:uncharacterized protein LOC118184818 isoform X2 [Stegodyphus dumicola]
MDLIKRLSQARQLTNEDYLELLINKHLKELDFTKFRYCSWKKVLERVMKIAEGLVKVNLDAKIFRKHRGKIKEIIGLLKNAEYLNASSECDDETLQIISKCCPELKELDLRIAFQVTDKGLRSLCESSGTVESSGTLNLRVLRLDSAVIKEETVTFILQSMPSLEIFSHRYVPRALCSLHNDGLHENETFSLTELDLRLYVSDLLEVLTTCTLLCPNIAKFYCLVTTQEHVDLCCKFPKLEDLTIRGLIQRPINLNNFLQIKGCNLISLDAENISISIPVLIENCQKLQKLRLNNVAFQHTKDDCMSILKHLKEFSSYPGASSSGASSAEALILILNTSPNIERLSVLHTEFSDLQLRNALLKYCELNSLKRLEFIYSDVDVNFLVLILQLCSSLQKLKIDYCYCISSEEIALLNEISSASRNAPEIIWNDFRKPRLRCD